jgi:hypothetical protein
MAERGEYRSISRSLFSGKDFRKLPERPRWIFTVLKMNSGMVGLDTWYEAELYSRLSEESGATIDQVKLALDFLEHENWIRREDNVVWVVGHLEHDPHLVSTNAKHRKSIQRHVAGLPRLAIVKAFVAAHQGWFPKDEAKTMGIGWVWDGYRKPSGRSTGVRGKGTDTHSIQETDNENETDNEKEKASAPDGAAPKSFGWVGEGAEWWAKNVGTIAPPRFGKTLKPAVDLHTWAKVFPAMKCYVEETKSRGKPTKLEWFAAEIVRWVEWAGMPATDEKGDLTPRGKAILGLSA